MVDSDYRQQYEPRYIAFQSLDQATSGTTIAKDNLGVEGQITTLRVYADEEVDVDIRVVSIDTGEEPIPLDPNDVDTDDPSIPEEKAEATRLYLEGQKSYTLGDFENPALEIGAYSQFRVILQSDLSTDASLSVNARVDERRG